MWGCSDKESLILSLNDIGCGTECFDFEENAGYFLLVPNYKYHKVCQLIKIGYLEDLRFPEASSFIKNNCNDLLWSEVMNNNPMILEILLDYGAESTQDDEGNTPLHYAAENGLFMISGSLLDYNEEQKSNKEGKTPLHIASGKGFIDIVELLILAGEKGNINKKDNNGNTALHYATENEHSDVARFLKKSGALDVENDMGRTAFDISMNVNKNCILAEILTPVIKKKVSNSPKEKTVPCGNLKIVKAALKVPFILFSPPPKRKVRGKL